MTPGPLNKPFEHAQIRFDEMVAYMKDVAELKEELTGGSTAVTSHATTSLTGHRTLPPSTIHHPPPTAAATAPVCAQSRSGTCCR